MILDDFVLDRLELDAGQASGLVGVVAIGTAVGAVIASMRMKLHHATRVMPLGIAMGVVVAGSLGIVKRWRVLQLPQKSHIFRCHPILIQAQKKR